MNRLLIFMTDFGLDDGAISAMEGVAYSVDIDLNIRHLTHNIPQYNIFEASYRLFQAINYWPEGTTFVSVVDPGVGSDRKSVVARTSTNQFIVTPDNGTLTHINRFVGIEEVHVIDENENRLKNSELSYTFHGRDIFAYTGARLASNQLSLAEVGPEIPVSSITTLELFGYRQFDDGIMGQVDILDVRFGSLW
ncbi:MAG: SAM-dependent chlorinase/fluorinase, partial [Erysipelotrichaceae bacterium]|nr:SAM-dependent chlorinase/fluorinase [Erysipelotrichaceae bacterium]